MPELSVVMPIYNEADKVTTSLTQVRGFLKDYVSSFEILAVNDGSKDDTAERIREYQKDAPEVLLIDNPHKGKGHAVWDGVMHARGDYIYIADTDFSASALELKKMFVWVKEQNFDIVIGVREGVGAKRINEPLLRHVMGRVFNYWIQLVAVRGIKDTQCGFKLFTRQAAKDVFSRFVIYGSGSKVISKPYLGAWDVEALFIARKLGYKIKEVPVTWTYVKTSRLSHARDSVKMALDVLKIRLYSILGKYNLSAQNTSSII